MRQFEEYGLPTTLTVVWRPVKFNISVLSLTVVTVMLSTHHNWKVFWESGLLIPGCKLSDWSSWSAGELYPEFWGIIIWGKQCESPSGVLLKCRVQVLPAYGLIKVKEVSVFSIDQVHGRRNQYVCRASMVPLFPAASEFKNWKPFTYVLLESPVTKTESPFAMNSFSSVLPIKDSNDSTVPA